MPFNVISLWRKDCKSNSFAVKFAIVEKPWHYTSDPIAWTGTILSDILCSERVSTECNQFNWTCDNCQNKVEHGHSIKSQASKNFSLGRTTYEAYVCRMNSRSKGSQAEKNTPWAYQEPAKLKASASSGSGRTRIIERETLHVCVCAFLLYLVIILLSWSSSSEQFWT